MRLAVISDIHGVTPALEAVLSDIEKWHPDQLVVNGDLVNRGPFSLQCLRLLQARAPNAMFVKGNHENFVLRSVDQPAQANEWDYDIQRFAEWTAEKLGGAVNTIRTWGDAVDIKDEEAGLSVHITHASRIGDRAGIYLSTPDEELEQKVGSSRDLFVCSHTHRPMTRHYNGTQVVNTGSVGQPVDDDPRASYGRFEFAGGQWRSEITRVAFDRERALRGYAESGFLDEAGPMARLIFKEAENAHSYVGPWRNRYMGALKAGGITVAESIDAYLRGL